jgi:hypothetical protein
MTTDFVETQLAAYVSLREALGFHMRAEKIILPDFVAFVKAHQNTGPIRAQMALEWACQASAHRGPSGAARRLSMARGFLLYLQASAPDTEVPAPGLLPAPRRPKPYLFTHPDNGPLRGGSSESSTWRLAPLHFIQCARAAGEHRSTGGRSHSLTDR